MTTTTDITATRRTAPGSEDTLRRYLAEIGRYPLLTRSDEVRLARRVEAGDHAARQRMIESNLRLVVSIARSYRTGTVDLLDLIQEGTIGLIRAVDRYDWRRDVKFSTFAAWCIRHEICAALAAGAHPVRVPESVRDRAMAVRRAERELTGRLGRHPSAVEVAMELRLSEDEVLEARAVHQPVGSLDEPVGPEGELRRADLLADANAVDPLESVVHEQTGAELESRLRQLPERSRRVIELRFGLGDGVARTADAVADELGLARERVRQIELQSIRRLVAAGDALPQAA